MILNCFVPCLSKVLRQSQYLRQKQAEMKGLL